jgi:hypothetical protein
MVFDNLSKEIDTHTKQTVKKYTITMKEKSKRNQNILLYESDLYDIFKIYR